VRGQRREAAIRRRPFRLRDGRWRLDRITGTVGHLALRATEVIRYVVAASFGVCRRYRSVLQIV